MGGVDQARARQEMVHPGRRGKRSIAKSIFAPAAIFRTVMRSPEGQEITNVGCFLEIVANRKLIWTVALKPGYRPSDPTFDVPAFTAIIMMQPHGKGTKYIALAMHKDEKDRNAHDRMGFSDGWGKALDQLVAAAKTM
jgi:uncharacterized protein YndB with AHSA1/START domain